jgi:ABC-type uncharacterized transport system ATPase subunit
MPHAEELCDHVVMMHRGKKVLDDPLSTIMRQYDPRAIRFEPLDRHADLSPLAALPEVERVSQADGGCEILLVNGTNPAGRFGSVNDPGRLTAANELSKTLTWPPAPSAA